MEPGRIVMSALWFSTVPAPSTQTDRPTDALSNRGSARAVVTTSRKPGGAGANVVVVVEVVVEVDDDVEVEVDVEVELEVDVAVVGTAVVVVAGADTDPAGRP